MIIFIVVVIVVVVVGGGVGVGVGVGVVILSFVSFSNGVVVAVHIIFVKYKCGLACLCWHKGRDISSDDANTCPHLLLMLLLSFVRERKVVSAPMAKDLVHLHHERDKRIINGVHR